MSAPREGRVCRARFWLYVTDPETRRAVRVGWVRRCRRGLAWLQGNAPRGWVLDCRTHLTYDIATTRESV